MYLKAIFLLLYSDKKKAGDKHLWKTYYKVDMLEAGNPEMSKAIPADEESLARWEKTDKPQLPCWL